MRQIYTVHINHRCVYHGINAVDAMQLIATAIYDNDNVTDVQIAPWPVEVTA